MLTSAQDMDINTNTFTGSIGKVLELITERTGLQFVPICGSSSSEIYDMMTRGEGDLLFYFDSDYQWAQQHNARITEPYASFNCILVKSSDIATPQTVAVVEGTYLAYYTEQSLSYNLVYCNSYKEAIELVRKGKADAAVCNATVGNFYSTYPEYSSLIFNTMFDFSTSYSIAVSNNSSINLLKILDKALASIPTAVMNSYFDQQINSRQSSITDIFYEHPVTSVAVIIILIIALVTMIFSFIYTKTVKRKNAQLITANHAKTDFLSRVSHEMRTPMNGILGLTALIKDKTDVEEIKSDVDQIALSGKYLLNLINDTLDMNKIEAGKLHLNVKPINSFELFSNIISNAIILANEKQVKLELKLPEIPEGKWICVMADGSRLEQILMNLISNAVKYTNPGGTVTLTMNTISITDTTVTDKYIIEDNGIGMDDKFLPHIFEPFAQEGRKNTERENGTGLGLSIVKQLIDLMGGTLTIESKINVGTKVTIEMPYPVYNGDNITPADESISLDVLSGKRVLLCEDHPLNATIAEKLLQKKNITVDLAENGKIGVEKFAASENGFYSAILMDVRMPIMNGIEATKAIRALSNSDAKTIPIIAMTANAFDDDVQNCLNAGMNSHLAKPVEPEILYKTLAKFISTK